MEPIVYVYEGQLRELLTKTEPITRGVAFEWKGEDVYHVHTTYPKVLPSGYPCVAFFQVESEKDGFEKALRTFDSLSDEVPNNNGFSRTVIGIFLYVDSTMLNKTAFIKSAGQVSRCEVKYVPEKSDLYSRSQGLLEVDVLENKSVLIIGLGSFGSHIAVELAKAGVGNFTLVDFDRIELSNVSRHICGVNELGRYKTFAVRDAIWVKNPYANVKTFEQDIYEDREALNQMIVNSDLVICVTDNNRSRFNVNESAIELNKVVLYGRAITRAEGGDIFRLRPNAGPCYNCLLGGKIKVAEDEISTVQQARKILPAYLQVSPESVQTAVQVGLSSDILPLCNMLVKLSLVELSKGLQSGIATLEEELVYDYYIWANRRDKEYLNWAPFNRSQRMPSILKWYGVVVPRDADCLVCNLK